MSQNQSSSIKRSSGKRTVRPPLRFGEQHEYVPSKFGLGAKSDTVDNSTNTTFNEVDAANVLLNIRECDTRSMVLDEGVSQEMDVSVIKSMSGSCGFRIGTSDDGRTYVTNVEQDGPAYSVLNIGDQIVEVNGSKTHHKTYQEVIDMIEYNDHEKPYNPIKIVYMKIIRILSIEESKLYQTRLKKYGKVCAETKQLCLGCEQDPNNMEWYSQTAWRRWTEAELDTPVGMIEWRSLKVKQDSWDMEVEDDIVFAEPIDSILETVCRFKDAHNGLDESVYKLDYSPEKSDEYAIINKVYLGDDYNWELEPVYLVISTGTVYPIEGSNDINSIDYNPIIQEVVGNLKKTLNGNYDPYNEDYGHAYYGVY